VQVQTRAARPLSIPQNRTQLRVDERIVCRDQRQVVNQGGGHQKPIRRVRMRTHDLTAANGNLEGQDRLLRWRPINRLGNPLARLLVELDAPALSQD